MTISSDLFQAILSMDAYNRGYDQGLNVSGNQIGNAVLDSNSSILLDTTTGQPLDAPASFFAPTLGTVKKLFRTGVRTTLWMH